MISAYEMLCHYHPVDELLGFTKMRSDVHKAHSVDLHHHNNSRSICENSDDYNAQRSDDIQMSVAL